MALPSYVAFSALESSIGSSLGIIGNNGYLEYSAQLFDTSAKFALEPASSDAGLVHIRSCSTNKYWRKVSPSADYITASENDPEEDITKENCTLFRPNVNNSPPSPTIWFVHIRTGGNVGLVRNPNGNNKLVLAIPPLADGSMPAESWLLDYDSLVKLPKRVVFKGANKRYLATRSIDGNPYNQFAGNSTSDQTAQYETFADKDGNFRVKSVHVNGYLKRTSPRNWILSDGAEENDNDLDKLFDVTKVDDNVVALRNKGNNRYCSRLSKDGKTDCYNADTTGITPDAHLLVSEPVRSRLISTVFGLDMARIYSRESVTFGTQLAPNPTHTPQDIKLEFPYLKTKTASWSNDVFGTAGLSIRVTSGILGINTRGVVVEAGQVSSQPYSWKVGVMNFSTEEVEDKTVFVPPRTQARVTMIATLGKFNVPFSYIQIDNLVTGENMSYDSHDGVYNGVDTYAIDFTIDYEPLT